MNTINLDQYVRTIKQHIEEIDDVNQVKVLGTSFNSDDINKLSHQDGKANILLVVSGGDVTTKGQQLWNNCTFGVFVVCGKDNDFETIGYSSHAIDITHQILAMIHQREFSKNHKSAFTVPKVRKFSAYTNQDFEKRGFVVWYCIFQQELRIA